MSEEQRITKVEKEKDPRRVEAGKKLAAMSKSAKEKKARQRSDTEHDKQLDSEECESTDSYSTITVITGVGVLAGLVCLYFTYKQDKRAQKQNVLHEKQHKIVETSEQQQQSNSKLRSLDD